MPDNPYTVVASPNYAAPLLDFSQLPGAPKKQQPQQNQQQQPVQQGQQQSPAQNMAARLRQLFGPQAQQAPTGPQAYQQPGAPLDLSQGSVAGANALTSGLY
jgi:hypothetical protein